jgi:phage tail sheath protein FI
MCAARGDMTAVLGLPYHYQADEAISYVTRLKSTRQQTADGSVPPLSYSEAHAFSYASLFHPWLLSRSNDKTGTFDAIPPDGAICGIFARRSLSRGAWIAPANETLRDVVALAPPIKSERWLPLQESRINLIRREPMGFVTLSADTLSDDSDLRPLNVRRLLILIRKLALKKGEEYVFETNDASFRRMVQHGFEAMLDEMFMRGAFSGATPALAYQVVTGDSLNTTQSVDQGRCIVELKVSPSRPMTFLTVRLMQTGDRMSIVEGA